VVSVTQLRNNFVGLSNGTTITTGNSGGSSGDAFDAIGTIPTGGVLAADNSRQLHAEVALKLSTSTTAGSPLVSWTTSMGAKARIFGRAYFQVDVFPAAKARFINFMSSATQCASVVVGTTGLISIRNSAGTDVTTSTSAISVDSWCRIEFDYTFSTTVGAASVAIYTTPDGTTPVQTITAAASQNFGASTANTFQFGSAGSSASLGPWWFADLGIDDTALLGPTGLAPSLVTAAAQ
jgi:hypothetical protein